MRVKEKLPLIVLPFLLALNGCAITSHGRLQNIRPDQVRKIEVGKSTQQDIINLFGEPQQIVEKPNSVSVFVYTHGWERSIGIPFIVTLGRVGGSGQSLSIVFVDGIVSDYDYTKDSRGIT